MRKFFKSILSVGVVMTIMASSSVCLGQASNYYLKNDSLVKENAEFVVGSLVKGDELDRAPYEDAVINAFNTYWKNKDVKVKFKWDELSKAQAESDKIKDEMVQNAKLAIEFQNELEETQKLIQREDNANIEKNLVMNYLNAMISRMEKESQALDMQITEEQQHLNMANDSLNQSNEEVNSAANSQSDVSRALASAEKLESLITALQNSLNADILSVNIADLDEAQNLYNQNIGYIEAFNQAQYNDLKGAMDLIMPYRPLIEALKKSTEAMASKYDASYNKDLAKEIESILKSGKSKNSSVKLDTKQLTPGQIAQCQAIISALKDEERSAKNLNYLLDYILREHPDGIEDAAAYDVATDIANVVNIVNPGQNRYNPYYVNFNNILDALETELKAQNRNSEELKKYIQQKKDEK